MGKKVIFILFILIFSNTLSSKIVIPNETSRMRLVDNDILEKELELKKLKELKVDLEKKNKKKEHPFKIGLVLSGGGAKGMAHIGTLRKLEEYGIKPDYITGTSFGSIIGALYSIGYTPDEIEKLMLEMDWDSFRNNKQGREYTSLKHKIQKEKYLFNLEVTDEYKLKIPKGVLTGEAFYLELKRLFSPAEGITDFDDLNIPFRAISTNVNTGEKNVVGEGDLAKAVFMSMAIPTVFDPVEDNGEYYVDGGLADNLPVSEVINMGADIVIAVDITAASTDINDKSNVFQVLEKLTSYAGQEQFEKSKKLSNVLIIPDVKDHSVADFTGLEKLIEKGSLETEKHEEELRSISRINNLEKTRENILPQEDEIVEVKDYKKGNIDEIEVKEEVKYITIDSISLSGNNKITEEKIEFLSKKEIPGKFTKDELLIWMNKAKALDIVDRLFYTIEDNQLKLQIHENQNKYMRIGLNYSDDYGPTLRLAADMTKYSLFDSEYMAMLEVSEYPKIQLQTFTNYTYKEMKYLALAEIGFSDNPLFLYKKDNKIATYDNYMFYLSGGLGTSVFNSYLLTNKFSYIGVNNKYRNGTTDLISSSSWEYFKNTTSFLSDTRDNAYFSQGGADNRIDFLIGTNLKVDGDTEFYGGIYDLHKYITITNKFNIELIASGGKIAGGNIPENEYLKIGGLRSNDSTNSFSFYGMNAMRKHTDEFYLGGIKLRYKLNSILYLNLQYNVVTYRDSEFKSLQEDVRLGQDYKHGVGVGLAVDSFLGPLDFVLSNDTDSDGVLLSLFLGYEF